MTRFTIRRLRLNDRTELVVRDNLTGRESDFDGNHETRLVKWMDEQERRLPTPEGMERR